MSEVIQPPIEMATIEVASNNPEIGSLQVSVSRQPIGLGNGVAHAEITTHQEAVELSQAVARNTVPIAEGSSTDCGDGRFLVGTHNGEQDLASSRLFGGTGNATSSMRVLDGAVSADTPYEEVYGGSVDTLKEAGTRPGGHTATDAEGEKSKCASLDDPQSVYGAAAKYANELKPFTSYFTESLGFVFSDEKYQVHASSAATAGASKVAFKDWTGKKGLDKTIESGGLVRILNAGPHENNPTHGHDESLIVVVLKQGITVDKQALQAQTGKMVFVVTLPELINEANALVATPDANQARKEVASKVQAGILFQLAHIAVVPDGSQYVTVIR